MQTKYFAMREFAPIKQALQIQSYLVLAEKHFPRLSVWIWSPNDAEYRIEIPSIFLLSKENNKVQVPKIFTLQKARTHSESQDLWGVTGHPHGNKELHKFTFDTSSLKAYSHPVRRLVCEGRIVDFRWFQSSDEWDTIVVLADTALRVVKVQNVQVSKEQFGDARGKKRKNCGVEVLAVVSLPEAAIPKLVLQQDFSSSCQFYTVFKNYLMLRSLENPAMAEKTVVGGRCLGQLCGGEILVQRDKNVLKFTK
jgi:hypothetical protein